MYIITNAIKNIGRNKGRNILIGIIIFAILLTSAVSIIINTTTGAIIEDYKNRFGSEVFINVDYALWQQYGTGEMSDWITPEQKMEFAKSDYLKNTNFVASLLYSPDDFESFDDMSMGGTLDGGGSSTGGVSGSGGGSSKSSIFTGDDHILENSDFKNGNRKIIDGKVFENDNECIISQQLAELNNFKVGDTLTVRSVFGSSTMTLTITGIYEDNTMLGNSFSLRNLNNEIITNFDTAINSALFNESNGSVEVEYFLKNPDDLEAFAKELSEKGLPKYYKVTTDEQGYKQVVGPVEGLAKVTNTFLIVVLILGSIILVVLSTMAIRERKYEIGVLRAMGMKKAKVAFGLLSEMLIITAVCLALGLGIGTVAAQPVADSLLAEQVAIAEEGTNNDGMVYLQPMGGSEPVNETLSEIDVTLSGEAVMQISLIALFLTVISSIGGILYITRFEPMKILSERS